MAAVSGITRDSTGALAQKLVRVYRRDTGYYVGSVLSDATTGAWSMTTADTTEHFALMHDAVGDPSYGATAFSLPLTSDLVDSRGHTFAANGGASVSGGALVLDGINDYLSCTSADFNPAASDFTLEAEVYVTSLSSNGTIFGNANTGGSDSALAVMVYTSGQVGFNVSANGSAIVSRDSASSAIPLNTWKHVACELYNDILYTYVNGVLSGSNVAFSSSVFSNSQPFLIGASRVSGSPANFLTGKIRAARFTFGARYKGAFTPPTTPYLGAISGGTQNAVIYDRLIPV